MYHCIFNSCYIQPHSLDGCGIIQPANDLVVTFIITTGHVISKIKTFIKRRCVTYSKGDLCIEHPLPLIVCICICYRPWQIVYLIIYNLAQS